MVLFQICTDMFYSFTILLEFLVLYSWTIVKYSFYEGCLIIQVSCTIENMFLMIFCSYFCCYCPSSTGIWVSLVVPRIQCKNSLRFEVLLSSFNRISAIAWLGMPWPYTEWGQYLHQMVLAKLDYICNWMKNLCLSKHILKSTQDRLKNLI